MYAKCTRFETAFFGNNESGKTTLIRRLTHDEFLPDYEETIITQVGVKLLDFKDKLDFPMYIRMFDTPGNAVSHLKDEETVFSNLDFVFVILDGTKVIHKEHVIAVNNYVVQRLREYNKKVRDKEQSNLKYREYLSKLTDEEIEDDGNFLSPDDLQDRSMPENRLKLQNDHLDIDEEDHLANSQIEHLHSENPGLSQHTIMNLRHESYKSNHSHREDIKDDASDIVNLYRKKQIKPAMMPAVFHIVTKKDLLAQEGLEDQMDRARALATEGVIDRYFFVSAKERDAEESGVKEMLEAINDRRLDMMREEQEERDSMRAVSQKSK